MKVTEEARLRHLQNIVWTLIHQTEEEDKHHALVEAYMNQAPPVTVRDQYLEVLPDHQETLKDLLAKVVETSTVDLTARRRAAHYLILDFATGESAVFLLGIAINHLTLQSIQILDHKDSYGVIREKFFAIFVETICAQHQNWKWISNPAGPGHKPIRIHLVDDHS